MKVKTLEQAKELAYKHLGVTNLDESKILIDDRYISDFEWGTVFPWNSRKYIENHDMIEALMGNLPILVDKHDGSSHKVGRITKILDVELEEYRESKGYSHCIKFPLKESIEGKSPIEQVQMLFESREIAQIKQGLAIAKEKKLFDLDEFERFMMQKKSFSANTLEETILIYFRGEQSMFFDKNNPLPQQTDVFGRVQSLDIYKAELNELDKRYFELPKLKTITIFDSKINKLPHEILSLKELEEVHLYSSKMGWQARKMLQELQTKSVKINLDKVFYLGWRSRFYPLK